MKTINKDKFNIVIDDGIHNKESVLTTLDSFMPNLKDDFVYFIEDIPNEYIPDIKEVHKLRMKRYPKRRIKSKNQISVLTKRK